MLGTGDLGEVGQDDAAVEGGEEGWVGWFGDEGGFGEVAVEGGRFFFDACRHGCCRCMIRGIRAA